ncbi:MAG: hypothetical protein HZA19_02415 [Nitrospirae bacterium]|nr:hypothetical protein [Nitrospirota bacterium]
MADVSFIQNVFALTTVTEGEFRYLRLPLTVPWIFFLVMMTSVIVLMVLLLVMSWRKK